MENVFYNDTKKSEKKSLYILQMILNAQMDSIKRIYYFD